MATRTQAATTVEQPALAGAALQQMELEERVDRLEQELARLRETAPDSNRVTILIFSGDQDKALAGLTIAATAASMGMEVTLFFTFWGISVLKQQRLYAGKDIKERMIDFMTPTGAAHMGVSQMNMMGVGAKMLQQMMDDKNVVSAEELLQLAQENGVRIVACSMTMQVMGLREEELMKGIEIAGAASYLTDASRSGCTLFI